MHPKLIGNPLVAWRDDTTLQVGWGAHSLVIDAAPPGLPRWLRMISGHRSLKALLEAAAACGITEELAQQILGDLEVVGLGAPAPPFAVAIHPCGLLEQPLRMALRDVGIQVQADSDVVVYPQGQVPCLLEAPRQARRLIPVWFAAQAVHVGPVLDHEVGPCPACIDGTWAKVDPAWATLVAQAGHVATWSTDAQPAHAASAIALIAQAESTVGLEVIIDPLAPGPQWRVWTVRPDCGCQAAPE